MAGETFVESLTDAFGSPRPDAAADGLPIRASLPASDAAPTRTVPDVEDGAWSVDERSPAEVRDACDRILRGVAARRAVNGRDEWRDWLVAG